MQFNTSSLRLLQIAFNVSIESQRWFHYGFETRWGDAAALVTL